MTDHILAYVGKPITQLPIVRGDVPAHELTDWHGNKIGIIRLTSTWKINSYVSTTMHQGYANVNGKLYTGRTMGENMAFKGRECRT